MSEKTQVASNLVMLKELKYLIEDGFAPIETIDRYICIFKNRYDLIEQKLANEQK